MNNYKLGSLFDGSGGFPLSGALCGIEPVWAAEVEPYPIAVTRSRFPTMKHLGDISKVNGGEIEPVDIITFGSPCQDLSVAGKRAGLKHEANGDEETTRSGLFMEAVRIIKEMRKATNGKYPTFAIWENVPGAFSSNNGEDFRIVCEELIKIVEPSASMPEVPQKGWNYADSYIGDGWSLAYRVFDAQYWGVPQRRRRIYLVADFRGERAREVLFEREGLRGYFTQGRTPWQETPADAQGSTGADDREGEDNNCITPWDVQSRRMYTPNGPWPSLYGGEGGGHGYVVTEPNGGDGRGRLDGIGVVNAIGGNAENYSETQTLPTLTCSSAPGFNNAVAVPYTLKIRSGCAVDANGKGAGKGALIQENLSATLATSNDQYLFQPVDPTFIIDNIGGQAEYGKESPVNGTLRAGCQGAVAYAPMVMESSKKVSIGLNGESQVSPTLIARMSSAVGTTQDGLILCEETRANELVVMATQQGGAEIRTDGKAPTLTAAAGMSGNNQPVICLQGNGIDRADTAGCNGKGWKEDTAYTLNTVDRPAVAYGLDRASYNQGQNAKFDFSVQEEQQPTLTARGPGAVCCTTGGFTQTTEEVAPTLMARDWKDPTCVCSNYIVRRLTPTECARLQGFADWWGVVEQKKELTEEEYLFWMEVRNTHARINGKKEQEYTEKQMLTWYNKLWTDSAEYKMWGNGIALPTALYCVQGAAEALTKTTEEDLDDWMN